MIGIKMKKSKVIYEILPTKKWKCLKCNKELQTIESIQDHQEIHEREK